MPKEDNVARALWKAKGKLYPCPNPTHEFEFGRLMGQWTWAEDCWSEVKSNGHLQNNYFRISSTESLDGYKYYNLILWRFNLLFAFKKNENT